MTMLSESMGRRPSENTTQIALRIPEEWLEKFDSMIPWLAKPGISVTRTDVIRAAIARGIESFEHDERIRLLAEKKARGEKPALADFVSPTRTRR